MRLLGESNIRVRPLNDAKAIDNGATFLSESFIFSIAGGLILFESYRSHRKEVTRRESVADDIQALQDEIEWLKGQLKQNKLLMEEYHLPKDMKPSILKQLHEKEVASAVVGETQGKHLTVPITVPASIPTAAVISSNQSRTV
ncbi:OPA3-like protein [Sugiyamaella lignohabitans]|uniref:OPA3-like protein n=1 Tax=Sugiyamaella lignohabitans TaxID=796027 RepID=A0A167DUD1_9ASCO|nr:OPA3-like protein [Sugiyamaella lignohabitans]ANB13301.1 OPA3-like protein [Sugiyamaella lignohabitans]